MAFIDWADSHRIIIMVLPPHTTHRLQPLDVGLFQLLSIVYALVLDALRNTSCGYVPIRKRLFFLLFKPAWDASFTEQNIRHAFAKAGIWPPDGTEIICMVTKPPSGPEVPF
jgi:hypothetical protein